ncbi:transcriptional regulator, TetR family [Pseudorhodobacter antarcticus]|jgi:TetR/AcrR family transcriptional repressor of nem operon|uniref:Transcriptional regulator, TetR family n=1 Tax=Pseudorhodobacter antarcticus TaxID=1077947 RepID=A0A1H8NRW6_9RHOB|nr:TetR/AcrR family transcriptional regulator [Pseudorhodobacter antarcticus]SEO32357.1 transcriptional regulator, TetR family [Pseudorhodobacter antarcticus]
MKSTLKDTRSHILAVGRSLTARQGYTGVGLNALLKAADVPKGSFYHYFPSKEAYGCALLEDFVEQYRKDLGATLLDTSQNARARFFGYFAGWLQKQTGPALQDRCLVVKLSAEVADLSPDMSKILRKGVEDIIASLSDTLDQGITEGSIAPLPDTKSLAQSIYHQWLGASLVAGLSRDDAALKAAMATTVQAVPAA